MELNSTEKVIAVLEAFIPFNEPMGTLQLAEKISIHRSSVSRILMILKQRGFVQQDKKSKLYRLGPAVSALGKSVNQSLNHHHLVSVAQPFLLRMSEQVGESVALVVIDNKQVYVPFRVMGPNPISVSFEHGDRGAINANCGIKSILAHLPPNELQEIMDFHFKLPSYTSHTKTKWAELKEQFAEIRNAGISFDLEEYNLDVFALGAPVFDGSNTPIGSITMLVPSIRADKVQDKKIQTLLKQTAKKISEKLAG